MQIVFKVLHHKEELKVQKILSLMELTCKPYQMQQFFMY